ncbi:MAG: cache domain-containing protein [Phycisphaerae bacterium]|nr:cache domain-containing protein [Phycisphaerae bacterium]
MKSRAIGILVAVVLLLGASGVFLLWRRPGASDSPAAPPSGRSVREAAYEQLDAIRRVKRRQLGEYLDRIRKTAVELRDDPVLRKCFFLEQDFYTLRQGASAPSDAVAAMRQLRDHILVHCLQKYRMFYNILFVDPRGDVFSTVMRADYRGQNLRNGALGETSLGRRLRDMPARAFLDYEFSTVSRRPSAFFVEPVHRDGVLAGWFVLQCSINNINDIFVRDENLGRTGEVFLVNRDCQMLTDSRFQADSSILNLHLSPENIQSKFAEGQGHKIVTDYRGFRAMTSFEVCSVMGSEWLLVAKIDEAEVLTNEYARCREEFRPRLLAALREQNVRYSSPAEPPSGALLVDMDEFRKARASESLVTYGVGTCTAILIHLPGRFAYLAHAGSYDSLYGGGNQDLLRNMIKRICTYEIPPSRIRRLRVVLVAPHMDTIARAVDTLVEEGIFLTQIRFMRNPDASTADVRHDVNTGTTLVKWMSRQPGSPTTWQRDTDVPRVGDLMRETLARE